MLSNFLLLNKIQKTYIINKYLVVQKNICEIICNYIALVYNAYIILIQTFISKERNNS